MDSRATAAVGQVQRVDGLTDGMTEVVHRVTVVETLPVLN